MKQVRTIGFIGLGAMGLPMAKRLVEAGYDVRSAVHRNKESGENFAAAGGQLVASFPDAVKEVDLVLSIVPDDKALETLYGDPAFFEALPQNVIILEMTSCAPATLQGIVRRYEGKTRNFIDAPVSGGTAGAASGGLTIFSAGEESLIEAVEPVLKVLGKNLFRLNAIGDGKALKAVNQMLAALNMVAVAEAYTLARRLNLDLEKFYAIVKESSGGSYIFKNKFPKVQNNDFAGGFKFRLMKKDLDIARDSAAGIDLPFLKLAGEIYDSCRDKDDLDFSVLSTLYSREWN